MGYYSSFKLFLKITKLFNESNVVNFVGFENCLLDLKFVCLVKSHKLVMRKEKKIANIFIMNFSTNLIHFEFQIILEMNKT